MILHRMPETELILTGRCAGRAATRLSSGLLGAGGDKVALSDAIEGLRAPRKAILDVLLRMLRIEQPL
jgi:hypothetical protein